MATAKLVAIADEVETTLDAASLEIAFTSTRRYVPYDQLKDLETISVSVVPQAERAVPDNRAEWSYEYDIFIFVQKRLTSAATEATDITAVDSVVKLAQDIADYFRFVRPTVQDVPLIAIETIPWNFEALQDKKLIISTVKLTFRGWRT
jgi:hypothetical protein